jgi:hypothetical protein
MRVLTLCPVAKNLGKIQCNSSTFPDAPDEFVINESSGLILSSKLSNKRCWQILRSCINSLLRPFTPNFLWNGIGIEQLDNINSEITYPLESFPSAIILCFIICL